MDIMGLMKQAQAMQQKLADAQAELEGKEVVGEAGGGLVRVTLSAKGAMKGISIDASLLKADEKEIVEDLIVTAHAEARKKGEALMADAMKSVTGGLPLPPGFKLPF